MKEEMKKAEEAIGKKEPSRFVNLKIRVIIMCAIAFLGALTGMNLAVFFLMLSRRGMSLPMSLTVWAINGAVLLVMYWPQLKARMGHK